MSAERRIIRFGFEERVTHLVAAISYLYLLLTGLAFWTPALFWLTIVLGGGYLSRLLHPWVGLVFAGVAALMYLTWRRDMHTTEGDRAWRRAIGGYVRNEDANVPPAGRFNYGQKQLFWVMMWGALALLVSGLVLWFPESVPLALRQLAVVVHAVAALVTIGAFIVHVYMSVAVVPGEMHAIVHGDVSESWARHHHPLWAEEMTGTRPASREVSAGDAAVGG